MKSIKLTIRKLGPIRNSEIEIMPFMIFSGESGLGKSYLAILCHYFFDVMSSPKRFNALFQKMNVGMENDKSHLSEEGIAFTLKKTDLEKWFATDVVDYLKYMLGNATFDADIMVSLPQSFPKKIPFTCKKGVEIINNQKQEYWAISVPGVVYRVGERSVNDEYPYSLLLSFLLLKRILEERLFKLNTFVLPPSRGPVLTEQVIPVTGLYTSFDKCITWLKRVPYQQTEINHEFCALMEDILEGDVSYDGERFMYNRHTTAIPLSAAAASIRELAILSMIAERTDLANMVVLFEEPEAHLHPAKQRAMADALSLMNTFGTYIQVTTHSDYLLRRLNELIKLQKIRERLNDENEYEKICKTIGINPFFSFDYNRMGAYLLERNMDGGSRIIKQSLEDGVPFSSFHNAIENSLSLDEKLTNILDGENN